MRTVGPTTIKSKLVIENRQEDCLFPYPEKQRQDRAFSFECPPAVPRPAQRNGSSPLRQRAQAVVRSLQVWRCYERQLRCPQVPSRGQVDVENAGHDPQKLVKRAGCEVDSGSPRLKK